VGKETSESKRPGTPTVRVIIADDDPLARRAVRDALQSDGVIVIAEAKDGQEAVELSRHYRPDVVLMDVVMPGMDGVTATRCLAERDEPPAVVMLSAADDDVLGLLCLRNGASGFLPKTTSLISLSRALVAASKGEVVVSRRLTKRLIEGLRQTPVDGHGLRPVRSPLTSREWEVLDLLCQNQSTDDIAHTLVVSGETVRSHVKNILRKLGVSSRKEAVAAAGKLRAGIAPDDRLAA
jgi:two-component system, NarL family, response regulator LiaR